MAHQLEYVTTGALLQCSQGTVPMPFVTTPRTSKIAGLQAGNASDKKSLTNIPSFVICQKQTQMAGGTPVPCVPQPLMWEDTYPAKVGGAETLLFRSCIHCPLGQGKIEFLTSGQLPIPPELSQQIKETKEEAEAALDQAEKEKNSVGEAGLLEGAIPIWGSGRDLIHSVQTGDGWGTALNAGFLVWDVASVVAGVFSFGTATVAMAGAKAGVRGLVKAGVHVAANGLKKQLAELAAKSLALKEGLKNIRPFLAKIPRICVTACFPAGTPVAVQDGYKPIEELQVGDQVWAWHEATGDLALKPVLQTLVRETDALVELQIGADTLQATAEHPFWANGGWKVAGELVVGDALLRSDGLTMPVSKVTHHTEHSATVYNVEVADWHTYLVSWWMFVVHNATVCLSQLTKQAKAKLGKWLSGLEKRAANYGKPNNKAFQIRHCGPEEVRIVGNGHKIWADTVDEARGVVVDAKYVENTKNSPFVSNSKVPDFIRDKIDKDVRDEMYRYAEVIKDPKNELQGLEIVTNTHEAVPYFEKLIDEYGINGGVVVKP